MDVFACSLIFRLGPCFMPIKDGVRPGAIGRPLTSSTLLLPSWTNEMSGLSVLQECLTTGTHSEQQAAWNLFDPLALYSTTSSVRGGVQCQLSWWTTDFPHAFRAR
jgi:hypothetical protein